MLYELQTKTPDVRGGEKRAATAVRDKHGRFMPAASEAFDSWQLDPEHGRKGGKARASTARRVKGKFA
jgi:hypothetical protein